MQYNEDLTGRTVTECAVAFSLASGIGCTVTDKKGNILHESGYGYATCEICKAANKNKDDCIQAHKYGLIQAERFGGKYIYFCNMGLTCFVSPIFAKEGEAARITAGPLLMVDMQDYIGYELAQMLQLSEEEREKIEQLLPKLPFAPVEKVESLSTLLFLSTGFINNAYETKRMLQAQDDDAIQGQVSAYITQLKSEQDKKPYPFETERELLNSVSTADRVGAQKQLNELFGYIFFSSGGELSTVKARIYELLVLISRSAMNSGASVDYTLLLMQSYQETISSLKTPEALCTWLVGAMNKFMDNVFNYSGVKHVDIISKADMYLRAHCTQKVSLEDVALEVSLSPAYFSRVFKREKGETFKRYVNRLRIEKSKNLLINSEVKMSDIAQMMGFEDQSYYTKVFKNITGVSPLRYKESKGRI